MVMEMMVIVMSEHFISHIEFDINLDIINDI